MEYEKKYNDLIARINEVKEIPSLCMKDKHHYNGYVETGIRDALDYIVSPESEDERIRKELLEEIEFIIPHDDETDSEGLILPSYHARIDRYKSYLEKQKPVEWSEEDEAKKERLISIVKRALHGNEYPLLNDNGATELITWLKSLRPQPHWKPSVEQVSILGKVFAGCELNTSERDSMVDLFYHLKDMI